MDAVGLTVFEPYINLYIQQYLIDSSVAYFFRLILTISGLNFYIAQKLSTLLHPPFNAAAVRRQGLSNM